MKTKILSIWAVLSLAFTAHAALFEDNFDNDAGGDGGGTGSFAKPWVIEGTLWGVAGTEADDTVQPAPDTDPNWAFFQTRGATNGTEDAAISIDTGAELLADTDYIVSFVTGSRSNNLFVGTFSVEIWDGDPTTSGTLLDSAVAPNLTTNLQTQAHSFTLNSGSTVSGNLYLRFLADTPDGGDYTQPLLDSVSIADLITPLPPFWTVDPIEDDAITEVSYTHTLDGLAVDPNGDPITYSRTPAGPTWLSVDSNGDLSGTPLLADEGTNTFTVVATAGIDATDAILQIVVSVPSSALFEDNFDNNDEGDGGGGGAFAKPWVIEGTTWDGPGTEDNSNQPDPGTEPNWAYFQALPDEVQAISIDTGAALLADTDYTVDFVTGSRDDNFFVGTFSVEIWDGAPEADGTPLDSAVVPNLTGNLQTQAHSFTLNSGSTVSGNLFLRFSANANGGAYTQPLLDSVRLNVEPDPEGLPVTISIATGTELELSWTNQIGKTYGVETKSNLIIGDWDSLTTGVNSAESEVIVTLPISPEDQLFFRVITE